jgi:hypothetical protein
MASASILAQSAASMARKPSSASGADNPLVLEKSWWNPPLRISDRHQWADGWPGLLYSETGHRCALPRPPARSRAVLATRQIRSKSDLAPYGWPGLRYSETPEQTCKRLQASTGASLRAAPATRRLDTQSTFCRPARRKTQQSRNESRLLTLSPF